MERFFGLIGIFFLLGCAYLMSTDRKAISWRPVLWGIGLQVVFAVFILYLRIGNFRVGEVFFRFFGGFFTNLLAYSDKGSDFLFQSFVTNTVEAPMLNLAFRVLPTIIFFSA
ncbi:MAG: Na+ dependent nucleoside transporter N-terminal domain-containing protein, partial [Candidatus Poribacteria bacterium]|nr:Na+ dependent nucleoside transporter N-terminal domain-containing protein [Candidatus Poribacteria bacterium]